jgi:hypothetical protein
MAKRRSARCRNGKPHRQKRKSRWLLAVGTKVGVWEVRSLAQSPKPVGSQTDTWSKYFWSKYFLEQSNLPGKACARQRGDVPAFFDPCRDHTPLRSTCAAQSRLEPERRRLRISWAPGRSEAFRKDHAPSIAVSQAFTGRTGLFPALNERHSLSIPRQCSLFVASFLAGVGEKDLLPFSELRNITHLRPY